MCSRDYLHRIRPESEETEEISKKINSNRQQKFKAWLDKAVEVNEPNSIANSDSAAEVEVAVMNQDVQMEL